MTTTNLKVLHCALMARPTSGIVAQMQWESLAAKTLGLTWDVKIYSAEVLPWNGGCERARSIRWSRLAPLQAFLNWMLLRVGYYWWIFGKSRSYDLILLRYSSYDLFQWIISFLLKEKLCLVNHTLEVPELSLDGSVLGVTKRLIESMVGPLTIGNAKAVIGVTGEIAEYEVSRALSKPEYSFVYPNGICFAPEVVAASPKRGLSTESEVQLLFVASFFYPWHGLDLLLDDLRSCPANFRLHLVGCMSSKDMRAAEMDARVIVHGSLCGDEIDRVMSQCAVGISSLALYRNGMREAAPLKTREYLRAGLPVYASYRDVFPEDFPFFYRGGPSMMDILSYARRVLSVSPEEVQSAAKPHIDKAYLLQSLYRSLLVVKDGAISSP